MTRFSILGGGWRTEGYLSAIRDLPDLFEITGVYVRNPQKRLTLSHKYNVSIWNNLEDLLKDPGDFVVNIGSRTALSDITSELLKANVPVLSETPPATSVETLCLLWENLNRLPMPPFLVAEQCYARPYFRAVARLLESGLLGSPVRMTLSMLHDYHGISILRKFLQAGFEHCIIRASYLPERVLASADRNGLKPNGEVNTSNLLSATLQFEGGTTGQYHFCNEQYFSQLRSNHLQICCECGEVFDTSIRFFSPEGDFIQAQMDRVDLGHHDNLEGYSNRGIVSLGKYLYKNPYSERMLTEPRRLTDDEIAICDCLLAMKRYIETGFAEYPAAEAFQDTYLALLMHQAAKSDQELRSEKMPWNSGRIV